MNKLLALGLLSVSAASAVSANPDVTSREYKLMLQTSQFSYNTESSDVNDFIDDAETAIEAAISRNVSGSASLSKIRDVKFFDTDGSCVISNIGYSFRERIESGDSEVTLKFRSEDRYISDFEDMSASSGSAESKLESDIGMSNTVTPPRPPITVPLMNWTILTINFQALTTITDFQAAQL
jgi:acyl-CoA synthetase (AMP-forming)/AMP-acid ligase II